MRLEIITIASTIDFLAVVRLAPDHIRFVARRGMDARHTFAAAAETLSVEERDEMRAELGVRSRVSDAPTQETAYPLTVGMTIDEVADALGCHVAL